MLYYSLWSPNLTTTRGEDQISSTVYIPLVVDIPHTEIHTVLQFENVPAAQRIHVCLVSRDTRFLKMIYVFIWAISSFKYLQTARVIYFLQSSTVSPTLTNNNNNPITGRGFLYIKLLLAVKVQQQFWEHVVQVELLRLVVSVRSSYINPWLKCVRHQD